MADLQKRKDRFGLALMMIREGCADPAGFARKILEEDAMVAERDTFQEYLERAEAAGKIDFSLRIMRTPEGTLDFYIHPANTDGETGDFSVNGAFVNRIGGNLGAGSSRPTIKLVGSAENRK